MFLFPDGSGSVGSYTALPTHDPKLTVIGFDSPFLSCPREYTLQIEAVARMYASTIQGQYPDIPCILCGCSIGGVYVFEVGKQLSAAGRDIKNLLLLDVPCPAVTSPMPEETVKLVKDHGILRLPKNSKTRDSGENLEHFIRSAAVLEKYYPEA